MSKITDDSSVRVRFVILHHQPKPRERSDAPAHGFPTHWDLMVEMPDALATWQLQADPTTDPSTAISAERIGDHRKAYLEYEGNVTQGRGTVRRIEAGTCAILESSADRWVLDLHGECLGGKYELRCTPENEWTWQRMGKH